MLRLFILDILLYRHFVKNEDATVVLALTMVTSINIYNYYYSIIKHNFVCKLVTEQRLPTVTLSTIDKMTSDTDFLTSTNRFNAEVNTDKKEVCKLNTTNNRTVMIVSMVTIVVSMVTNCCIVGRIYVFHNRQNKQDVNESSI